MSDEVNSETIDALRHAGWFPGRRVATSEWVAEMEGEGFVFHPAATSFLSEFGGLAVASHGTGITMARMPFSLNPLLCSGESDRFEDWGNEVRRTLSPAGELDHGRLFLAIDENGVLYWMDNRLGRLDVGISGLDMLTRGISAIEVL